MRVGRQLTGLLAVALAVAVPTAGCRSTREHRHEADEAARNIIKQKQQQVFGRQEPFTIERPADTLRRRLLLDQKLPLAGPASLGTADLKPIKHWPEDDYLDPAKRPPEANASGYSGGVLRLSLVQALQVAAANSREYQQTKENIFQDAMALELERDQFRATWAGVLSSNASADLGGDDTVSGVVNSGELGVTQRFANGTRATLALAMDLSKLLVPGYNYSTGIAADASVVVPLMRGSGEWIVQEPLTQAERNVAYDLLDFDQYKRQFAVNIASAYLAVLQQFDRLQNQEDNYKRVITSTRRSRRLADAGRLSEVEYDQAFQQELSARDSWIAAQQTVQRQLDSFKLLLGLPPDASVELDPEELRRLEKSTDRLLRVTPPQEISNAAATQPTTRVQGVIAPASQSAAATQSAGGIAGTAAGIATTQGADEPIILVPPSKKDAGPWELPEEQAIRLALEHRPDLRTVQGGVYDAERQVVVAADALRAGLDLAGNASMGQRRSSVGSATLADAQLRPEKGFYSAGAIVDLPLERTAQQNAYRASLISLESATRAVQQAEDDIKSSVRNQLRTLLQAGESLKTQSQAVAVARRRVDSTDKFLQAGRALMRDVLDAQASLVSAQNQLTSALVDYHIAELQLQRDLGLLEVNEAGLWRENPPEGRRK